MTHKHHITARHNWLVRYYRAQLRFCLHVFSALWILPPPLAAAGFAWLRRTEVPKRGRRVSHPIRSKILIPAALLLATALLVLVAGCDQRSTPNPAGTAVPSSDATLTPASLDEWRVPVTADSHEYAIAFARAIWTYDASKHNYSDWVNGVSMFAEAASSSEIVARSMLPGAAEWQQLNVENARATVADITAETTPELAKLKASHGLPHGWQAYVVRGEQTVTLEKVTKTIPRLAAISVVCDYTCKFWSASAQTTR